MHGVAELGTDAFDAFVSGIVARAEASSRDRRLCRLGPLTLDLGGTDAALLDVFRRGLALSDEPPGAARLRIDLLVGEAGGECPPPEWPLPLLCNDHRRRRHADEAVALTSWGQGAVWQVFDRRCCRAVYWARSRQAIPEWDYGAPFRTLLAWALEPLGLAMVHGAAIGRPSDAGVAGRGLLLAGSGGAGKSSTTFVALREAGLMTAGDDFVALDCRATPTAHALFTTLKLAGDSLARLSVPAAAVANSGRPSGEKARLYLRELFPGSDLPRMPIGALVLPRLDGGPASSFRRIGGAPLLRALAPSSLFLLPGRDRERFAALASLAKSLPCYELRLGGDPDDLATALHRLLDEVARG